MLECGIKWIVVFPLMVDPVKPCARWEISFVLLLFQMVAVAGLLMSLWKVWAAPVTGWRTALAIGRGLEVGVSRLSGVGGPGRSRSSVYPWIQIGGGDEGVISEKFF